MSQLRNKPVAREPGAPLGPKDAADGPSARRVIFFGSIVIVVFVALLLGGIRVFLFPMWEANSEGVRQVATAQAQISAASTREALTPSRLPTGSAAVCRNRRISPTTVAHSLRRPQATRCRPPQRRTIIGNSALPDSARDLRRPLALPLNRCARARALTSAGSLGGGSSRSATATRAGELWSPSSR